MPPAIPARPRSTLLILLALWIAFYASFTLFTPPLLDDADSVHAEVAREMLLRHDYITLYANGIRYLEKAPLLYWSMAATMRVFQLFGATSPRSLAVAARFPLALAILALALLLEAFARRLFYTTRAGLYAALILLSSFGIFLFARITIPDAAVCLFTTLALYFFWRTEELASPQSSVTSTAPKQSSVTSTEAPRTAVISTEAQRSGETRSPTPHLRLYCGGFAAACALNVLTKGLIGVVFPVAIVVLYLLLTRGLKRAARRLRELHPWATFEAFFLIAAPWHILAGLANPTEGHPAPFQFIPGTSDIPSHWLIPLPTLGNVHGWFWFYFMNEHVLRYLNLRIPRDYDTAPLWLFWGLCFIWMMPWSAFVFKATAWAAPFFGDTNRTSIFRSQFRRHDLPLKRRGALLLLVWAAVILIFFTFSTRQEYYVLPALPAFALLIAGWMAFIPDLKGERERRRDSAKHAIQTLVVFGSLFATASIYLLIRTRSVSSTTDLASLLTQNPSDYALSLGHFLDLTGPSIALFRTPLILAALGLLLGPLAALFFIRKLIPKGAAAALAAGAFTFLLAAHLGLQTFAPVLTSAQLAEAIAPQVHPQDLVAIHGEYESGSTLGFYLQRDNIHILEGRSSNLWYGSFFSDAPPIFETPESIAHKWASPQRIFLWQSLTDPPNQLPPLSGPVYILIKSGGKEIVSNQPNR
jgi:4-amino-4-deoxy-L-arabinose transferase-like glycosyltransferase